MSNPSSTASAALPAGSRLGEFEITGVIGEGGFGIVYSARDSSLDRIVAIKEYLPAAFASRNDTGMVYVRAEEHSKTFNAGLSSFINEARMLAKFSHPGLVEVFRFWEGNGTAYMAMRYYRGVTLREMLRSNPQVVTDQWLCETLDPILLALQELHHEKCYHRDVAPDNILVLPNGRSVLMDFGAARRIIGGMTRALTTVLKPGYAPIEQYSDDGSMAQGAWTDIYAVGGVLYHAMTGKVPVQAISRMMNDPLKPVATAARGEFSANLCEVVMKCLSVMPENRYQTVDELRAALGWVTTPVSSTVIYTKTTLAPAVNHVVPAEGPYTATPRVAHTAAMGQLDPMAQLAAGPQGSDALSDLLSAPRAAPGGAIPALTPNAMQPAAPKRVSEPKTAAAPTSPRTSDRGDAAATAIPSKRGPLPLILMGVAVLTVVGAAAYLFLNGSSAPPATSASTAVDKPASELKANPPAQPTPVTAAVPPVTAVVETPVQPAPGPAPAAIPTPTPTAPPAAVAESPASSAAPTAAIATGSVSFDIKPWGNIVVDGISRGASPPMKKLTLPPGAHTIEIQNPAGPTVTRTIEIVPGKSVSLRHVF